MKTPKTLRSTLALVVGLAAFCCLGCSKPATDPASTSTPQANPTAAVTPAATGTPSAVTSSTEDGEWVDSEISSGLLVVAAPEPLVATDTGDTTVVYATSDEKYAVIVTVGDKMDEDPEAALDMLKTMVIQQASAEETHSEKSTFEGAPALRFGLKAKDATGKDVPVEMMTTFIGDNILVQAAVTDGNHERFFDSFELLEPEVGDGEEAEEDPEGEATEETDSEEG